MTESSTLKRPRQFPRSMPGTLVMPGTLFRALLTFALTLVCVLPAGAITVEIHYAGRPAVIHTTNFLPATLIFSQLDSWRLDTEARIPIELEGRYNMHSFGAHLVEDVSIELIGQDAGTADLRLKVYGGHIWGRFHCAGGTDYNVDVHFDHAQVDAKYSLVSGLSPLELSLPGLDLDISGFSFGFGACTAISAFDLVSGGAIFDWAEGALEGAIEDSIDDGVLPVLNVGGLGNTFLAADDYLEPIPEALFDAIGLDKNDVLDVVRNPFDGIYVQLRFDEGAPGSFGADDRIELIIEVPWELRPVANFSNSAYAGRIKFDASASRDPDGGGIVRYEWDYGDGTSNTSTAPLVVHEYAQHGTYTATLTVFDDEGARMVTSRTINTCSYLDCSGGGGGGDGPFNPDIE